MTMKKVKHLLYVLVLIGSAGILSGSACDDAAAACGIECPAQGEGIVGGNASITGIASIDGFFAAVVNFDTQANLVADGINGELVARSVSKAVQGLTFPVGSRLPFKPSLIWKATSASIFNRPGARYQPRPALRQPPSATLRSIPVPSKHLVRASAKWIPVK